MIRFIRMLKIIRRQRKLINQLREACWEWQAVAGRNEDKMYKAYERMGENEARYRKELAAVATTGDEK